MVAPARPASCAAVGRVPARAPQPRYGFRRSNRIASRMNADRARIPFTSENGAMPGDPATSLPLLTHLRDLDVADWLRSSLTTFATNVASFLPGHLPAYARLYHPFDFGGGAAPAGGTWRDLATRAGRELSDPAAAADFALYGVANAQAPVGTMPPDLIQALLPHLETAAATPEACYFAVWEGLGCSVVPPTRMPTLELPHRAYHLFAGPLAAARTSYSPMPWGHQSANLWWPADRAWCVATEIDFGWSYVGGPRTCIEAVLADARFEAVPTTATARW